MIVKNHLFLLFLLGICLSNDLQSTQLSDQDDQRIHTILQRSIDAYYTEISCLDFFDFEEEGQIISSLKVLEQKIGDEQDRYNLLKKGLEDITVLLKTIRGTTIQDSHSPNPVGDILKETGYQSCRDLRKDHFVISQALEKIGEKITKYQDARNWYKYNMIDPLMTIENVLSYLKETKPDLVTELKETEILGYLSEFSEVKRTRHL